MLSHLPCEALHLPDFRLVLVFGWVNLDNHWGCDCSTASARFAFDVEGCLIDRLGKLYSHCLTTAGNMPTEIELETPQIKDVATTFFIQAVRHFDL